MTTASSISADFFASVSIFALADVFVPADTLTPANSLTPTNLVRFPHAGLSVIQDITKPFFIGKLVIAADNTTT